MGAFAGAGCALLTGGTDGYTLADSGSAGLTTCASMSSCDDGGVCCVADIPGASSIGVCQPSCPAGTVPLCDPSVGCTDGGLADAAPTALDVSPAALDAPGSAANVPPGSD